MPLNIGGICSILITENIATLHELKTIYDLEDIMLMHECVMVKYNNEVEAMERSKNNG